MNEEDDEAEGSRSSLPTKQIKISIQLSFHDIVLLCIYCAERRSTTQYGGDLVTLCNVMKRYIDVGYKKQNF